MISVIGSLNMDLFIETTRLPRPGETVLGKNLHRIPGGKGANQAIAVARMGAKSAMIGAVGDDRFGAELLANLEAAGVGPKGIHPPKGVATGTALIVVDPAGQNQNVVAPGANATVSADDIRQRQRLFHRARAVIAQLEIPLAAVKAAPAST
jgi:ribokinase